MGKQPSGEDTAKPPLHPLPPEEALPHPLFLMPASSVQGDYMTLARLISTFCPHHERLGEHDRGCSNRSLLWDFGWTREGERLPKPPKDGRLSAVSSMMGHKGVDGAPS